MGQDAMSSMGENMVSRNFDITKGYQNLRKTVGGFNFEKFQHLIDRQEKKRGEVPAEEFKGLPLIKNKYRVISVLGEGAFGQVLKVQNAKSKEFFAMKSIGMLEGHESEEDWERDEKERVMESAKTELRLLPKLRHQNIVRYVESFVIPRSPVEHATPEYEENHLCLVMEYVRGSDLDMLLTFSEQNKFSIGGCLTIKWFMKLLETCAFFHKGGIVHRDLKPDNILVYYADLEDIDSMNLKITDFGMARNIKREGKDNQISGHIFYTAPEILNEVEYDSLCDIWSLGIILLQVFFGISIDSYQNQMKMLFQKVKDTPKLNREFCRRFGLKNIYTGTTYIKLMQYLHESGMYRSSFLEPLYSSAKFDSVGVLSVLECMVCVSKRRKYAKQLLQHPVVRTWRAIINLEYVTSPREVDLRGVVTFLRVCRKPYDYKWLEHTLQVCSKLIDCGEAKQFIKFNGLELLFEKFQVYHEFPPLVNRCLKLLLKLVVKNPESLREVTKLLRECYLVDIVKDNLIAEDTKDNEIFYLNYLFVKRCRTFSILYKDIALELVKKYCRTFNRILFHIIACLVPFLDDKEVFTKVFDIYEYNDVLFCKNTRFKYISPSERESCLKLVLKRICSRVKELYEDPSCDREELAENLLTIAYNFLGEDDVKTIKYEMAIPSKFTSNEVQFVKDGGNVELSGPQMHCNDGSEDVHSELRSANPIYVHGNNGSGTKAVVRGYFETYIWDGGNNDSLSLGVTVDRKKVLLRAAGGMIEVFEGGSRKKVFKYQKTVAFSDCYIGVGVMSSGKLFFTYNKKIIVPFVDLGLRAGAQVYACWRVGGNEYLRTHVNFGKASFHCLFMGSKPPKARKRYKFEEKLVNVKLISWIADKFKNHAVISSVCKTIVVMKKTKMFKLKDSKLLDEYLKDRSMEEIYAMNQAFCFKPPEPKPRRGNVYKFVEPSYQRRKLPKRPPKRPARGKPGRFRR